MSLFGGFFSSIGSGIGKLYSRVAKPLVTGLAAQYLGQGAGKLVGQALATKHERDVARGESIDLSQILPSYATTSGGGSTGYMQDPGVMQAYQMQNPIRTQYFPSINTPPEPEYYDEEEEEEEEYQEEDSGGYDYQY